MAQHKTMMIIEINEPVLSKVVAVRGDANARFIDVQLFDNGVPMSLNGHTVTLSVKTDPRTPMKNPIDEFIAGQIVDTSNGRCMFPLTTSMLAEAGNLIAQISIFSGETEVLSTLQFNIYVEPSLRSDEQIEATNEYGALVVLFSEIQNALDDMHAIASSFGEPSEESMEAGTDTFWKVLEKSIAGTAALVSYDIPAKIGNELDQEPYNTLFGKLNRIIALQLKDGEEIFTESGSFQVPEVVNQITVIASGAGGGSADTGVAIGTGGGGGSCVEKTFSVTPGETIQITIGKGGDKGGNYADHNGKDGGATIIGNLLTCPGGGGGKVGVNDGGASGGPGGGKGGAIASSQAVGESGASGLYGAGGKGIEHRSGGGGSYGKGGDAGSSSSDTSASKGIYGSGAGACPGGEVGGDGIAIIRWGAGAV